MIFYQTFCLGEHKRVFKT